MAGLRTPVPVVIAGKDLRRSLKSRSLVLTAVVGPLALGLIMALAFGGGSGPSATIAVVDRDGTPTSRAIVDTLRRDLRGSQVRVRTDVPDPERAVDAGRVDAAVVIPPGWTESLSGSPEPLQAVRDPDRAIPGEIATSIAGQVSSQADLVRAATSTAAALGADPSGATQVRPVVSVSVQDLSDEFNAPLYFGPLTIFLFLAMGTGARGLVREQKEGTLDRIRSTPTSARTIVAGSSLGVMAQGLVASLLVYGVSAVVFNAEWGRPAEVIVVLVSFVVAISGFAAIIVALARTEPQAEGWNNAIAFLFGILGGAFFGGASLPGLLGAVGSLTPNSIAMRALIELGPGGQDLASVLPLLVALWAMGIAGVLLGGSMLRRRLL
ncbi:MAG: ABC transporter permease [Microthrixaceae bacterium]